MPEIVRHIIRGASETLHSVEKHRKVQVAVTSGLLITTMVPAFEGGAQVLFFVNLATNLIWIWAE